MRKNELKITNMNYVTLRDMPIHRTWKLKLESDKI